MKRSKRYAIEVSFMNLIGDFLMVEKIRSYESAGDALEAVIVHAASGAHTGVEVTNVDGEVQFTATMPDGKPGRLVAIGWVE